MEIVLLSTLHQNAAGILRITPEEIAVYDPITGKKKLRAVGVEYADDLIIPEKTSSEQILPPGAVVYDNTARTLYVGDGQTPGGNPLTGNLWTGDQEGRVSSLEGRVSSLEEAIGEFESSGMEIIGE